MSKRPGLLTAIAVFAIVFGVLGLMKSLVSVAGLLFNEKVQTMVIDLQPKAPNDAMQDVMTRMQNETMQLQERYKWINVGLAATNFLLSAGLLIGGILAIRSTPAGRSMLIGLFLLAALYELAVIYPTFAMQNEAMAIQKQYMPLIMQASAPPGRGGMPPGMGGMMSTFMEAGGIIAIVFGIGWTLAKVAADVFGFIYLRRPAIRALFSPEPAIAGPAPQGDVDLGDFGQWDEPEQP